jgi:hypothetical protein
VATFRTTRRIKISEGKEIWVVREDRNDTVLMSVVENGAQALRRRLTMELPLHKAIELARALSGITLMEGIADDFEEDEPTNPD